MNPDSDPDMTIGEFNTKWEIKFGPSDSVDIITGGDVLRNLSSRYSMSMYNLEPEEPAVEIPIIDDVDDEDDRELIQELVIVSRQVDYNSERPEYVYAKAVRSLGWVPGSVAQQAELQRDDALREVEKLQQKIRDMDAEKIAAEKKNDCRETIQVSVDPASAGGGIWYTTSKAPDPNITVHNTFALDGQATQRLVRQLQDYKRY